VKCIVVTDIHGLPTEEACFLSGLGPSVTIQRIGLADLLGVHLRGEELYRHLVENGGFDKAVTRTLELFGAADIGLGYSSGGAVLWKSVLRGLPLKRLVCISSTRLRDETSNAMRIPTLAVFGDQDNARPPVSWGSGGVLEVVLLPQAEHAFYCTRDANWMKCRESVLNFLRPCGI